MATIEHFVEQWAQEKRKTLSMTEQESVRVWNVIQSKLETEHASVVVGRPSPVSLWLQSLMRWGIVPVAAMALLVLTTTVEKNTDIQGSPQPLPVVSNNNKNDTTPLNVVANEETKPLLTSPLRKGEEGWGSGRGGAIVSTASSKRPLVVKRELYATRGQSVFVAWGTSVFSPEQLTSTSQEQFGRSVFSEL